MDLAELLKKAGITDIVIPRKEFVKEHTHLIRLLKKPASVAMLRREAAAQEKELAGASRAAGFVRRMMAENALKHKGQYRNPSAPLVEGSRMYKPATFNYKLLANEEQGGTNDEEYGASPFIQKHFASKKPVAFERKEPSEWAENYKSGEPFDSVVERVFRPKTGKTKKTKKPTVKKSEAPPPPPPPSPPKAAPQKGRLLLSKNPAKNWLANPAMFLKDGSKKDIGEAYDTPADPSAPMGSGGDSILWAIISKLSPAELKKVFRKRFPSDEVPSDDRVAVELLEKLVFDQ